MRLNNHSGMILLVVLWIMVILSLLAIGLGRRTSIELALTRYSLGQMKSKYAAMAGVVYAQEMIKKDTDQIDTKGKCGFLLTDRETPEDIFAEVPVDSGSFDISYPSPEAAKDTSYGFEDEESKFNINALTPNNYKILVHLLTDLGYEDTIAQEITSAIVDWRDENNDVFNESMGAEEDFYSDQNQGYHCKNGPFDSLEELLLVKGMTAEVFSQMKPYITIFPKQGNLLINLNTASKPVLLAWAKSLTGGQTNTALEDADALAEKIVTSRMGGDQLLGTDDDKLVEMSEMPLNQKENALLLTMAQSQTKISKYLRIHVKGVDKNSSVASFIDAVIYRDDLSIVYWYRR